MTERSRARLQQKGGTRELVIAVLVKSGEKRKWRKVVDAHVAADLKAALEELGVGAEDGVEVDYELKNGQPQRVRFPDQPWEEQQPPKQDHRRPVRVAGDEFLNPYAFVPAPERTEELREGSLGDHVPAPHGRAARGTWTGRIVVDATALTPLLFLDTARSPGEEVGAEGKLHRTYGVRTDTDGNPIFPITGFKGALRAAYEAVTRSRFGVWSTEWDRPIEYRDRRERCPWPVSPRELADDAVLLPATSLKELSAADRVFGWVRSGGTGADRGQLRIRSIRHTPPASEPGGEAPGADNPPSVTRLRRPIPLAILGPPKPTQGRFYASPDRSGGPHRDEEDKRTLYRQGGGLRGRKFYWHHAGAPTTDPAYWTDDPGRLTEARDGWFAEYRYPGDELSDQHRSIDSWVTPGVTFRIEIDVTNLSDEELGALLWLCKDPGAGRAASLRVGYGKPLGFGSVRFTIDPKATRLWVVGESEVSGAPDLVTDRYRSLTDPGPDAGNTELVVASVVEVLIERFTKVADPAVLEAYRKIMRGDPETRVHYPRLGADGADGPPPPNPDGENFRWFVANERIPSGAWRPLPAATANDPSIPYDPVGQNQQRDGRYGGRR